MAALSIPDHKKAVFRARGGITIICLLVILIGQSYLLRNVLYTDAAVLLIMPWITELLFSFIFIAVIVYLFFEPRGWYTKKRLVSAFLVLIAYSALTILYYPVFKEAYLTGFTPEYESSAGGLVGLKLVLAVVGLTAGIPVADSLTGKEYARRLREKFTEQSTQLTKEALISAQEELAYRMRQLHTAEDVEKTHEVIEEQTNVSDKKDMLREEWHGWGGGV